MNNTILAIGGIPPKKDYLWVTWSILTKCNYNCRYCYIKGNLSSTRECIDNTIQFLKKTPQKYKDVTLFGGEPSIHHDIMYIIDNIRFCKNIYIFTNLSSDIKLLSNFIDKNVKFCISYHPDIVSSNIFKKKLQFLIKNNAYIEFLNVMLVSNELTYIEDILKFCRDNSIRHRILPIYTEGAKTDWITSVLYSRRTDVIPVRNTVVLKNNKRLVLNEQECILLGYENFYGYICYAGVRSIFIDCSGNVYRCQKDMQNKNVLCKVTEKYPNEKYYKCPYSKCTCEYYIPKELKLGYGNNLFDESINEF